MFFKKYWVYLQNLQIVININLLFLDGREVSLLQIFAARVTVDSAHIFVNTLHAAEEHNFTLVTFYFLVSERQWTFQTYVVLAFLKIQYTLYRILSGFLRNMYKETGVFGIKCILYNPVECSE